jgi:membrane protein DedA with SNARE-associated domain
MIQVKDLINEIGALSYLGMWLVAILVNVVIPVPEEIILLAFGYLAGTPAVSGLILAPLVISGLLVSDLLMYFFSKRGNRFLSMFYDRVFAKQIENRREWIERHMNKVIFFSRFMLQLRFLGPFLAGQKRVPVKKFFMLDFLALMVYVPIYMAIGWYFHSRIDYIADGVNEVKNVVIVVLLIFALVWLVRFFRKWLLKMNTGIKPKDEGKD